MQSFIAASIPLNFWWSSSHCWFGTEFSRRDWQFSGRDWQLLIWNGIFREGCRWRFLSCLKANLSRLVGGKMTVRGQWYALTCVAAVVTAGGHSINNISNISIRISISIISISDRISDPNTWYTWDCNFSHPWTTSWYFFIVCICVFESPEHHFWCPWTLAWLWLFKNIAL